MSSIDNDLLTGNKQLDLEHDHILSLLHNISLAAGLKDYKLVIELYNKFLDYITDHFVYEEYLMKISRYPEEAAMSHINGHRLLQEIYLTVVQLNPNDQTERIVELFRSEFISHLISHDKRLAQHLRGLNYLLHDPN